MSDLQQNERVGPASEPADAESLLRFACMNCGKELTAPVSAAGVEGPCPICGTTIKAPQAFPAGSGEPGAIAPRPREVPRRAVDEAPSPEGAATPETPSPAAARKPAPSTVEQTAASAPAPARSGLPGERSGRSRGRRSIDPTTGYSSTYEDRKEVGAVVRIFLSVLLTAAIAWAVVYVVNRKINTPPPEPELEFPINP